MVHKPLCPGSLRLMCLRMISQAIYSYLDARPRLEKYFQLCGPQCKNETSKLINYITSFFPFNLRDLLLEFLTQLWFSKLLKMKQKTIDHERMSAGDPHHDHATCGGTTSVSAAQKQTDLMAEILNVAMTKHTKNLRFGFTNARSGPVNFSRPLAVIQQRCHSLRHLDLTFATDTLLPTKPGVEVDNFNAVFLRDGLEIMKKLVTYNTLSTLKLLMCDRLMLMEIAKLSKLSLLEITEASLLRDTDLASFSHGSVRHNLSVLKIKFWSDVDHINHLCDTQAPRKLYRVLSANSMNNRVTIPSWAVFILNCPNLTQLQYFEHSQPRPFNPLIGLLTIIREVKKWGTIELENDGDLLDIVLESPQDWDRLKFKWSGFSIDMGHDGILEQQTELTLNTYMETLLTSLSNMTKLTLTFFPTPIEFHTLDALTTTPAGKHFASKLKELKILASHPSHWVKISELLTHTTNLEILTVEHLKLPNPHGHHLVVNIDVRDMLLWSPKTLHTLKIRGFHLLRRVNMEMAEGSGPSYPHIKTLEIVFCGSSDRELLHVCCLCPQLEHLTLVVSMTAMMTPNAPPQPPQHGMVASHLHSLCHNSSLVEAIVLVKVGEGWIQIDDREMLGELVLSSASQHLRKIVLFPIRGICGGGLRSLVRAAKERNICLNIGIGNQRPVKTETNRRTGIDEFVLVSNTTQDYFSEFGNFLKKKISEYEGQFWNDPDWFYGAIWPESGIELE